jgi:hypothetical protein
MIMRFAATLISLCIFLLLYPAGAACFDNGPVDIKKEELRGSPAPVTAGYGPRGMKLQGIITAGGRAVAIINRGLYIEGDSIGDFRIAGIWADRVLIEQGKRKFYIRIEGLR